MKCPICGTEIPRLFAEVELAHGMYVRISANYEEIKQLVEDAEPSRWYNPVLIVCEKPIVCTGEDEIKRQGNLEDIVVAVPKRRWGYGNQYRQFVEANRKKFGLP